MKNSLSHLGQSTMTGGFLAINIRSQATGVGRQAPEPHPNTGHFRQNSKGHRPRTGRDPL